MEAQASEAATRLQSTGAKLVCIDFDATFVTVHTGGLWAASAAELRTHVRPFFLLLVPLLCEKRVNVAIVTFSPQVQLIRDVLRLSFCASVLDQLVVRGDDRSWSLTLDQTTDFVPLWQTDGHQLDRKYKLPFVISAALEVQRRSGDVIRNRDTVLVDDDVVNIRAANDSGVVGVLFDSVEQDIDSFCKRIKRLQVVEPEFTPLRTPSKKPRSGLKLVAKSNNKCLSTGSGSGARRRLGLATENRSTRKSSKFIMCTPSPGMKLKCSVDVGRPRSKRAAKILRNYSRAIGSDSPVLSSTSPVAQIPLPSTIQRAHGLQTSDAV
ncbi:hypothetical protein PsorP6_006112 [Peronosclerospora sorghi]|uniref:Uncharacterized protein n=1 Tax=Peronosclerospora sorghi TaxID=230839 RepID=A0ACC0W551_9STRA|nr:hypothetical protein PsorP6_006112 [Peronosclerospora sorghi]